MGKGGINKNSKIYVAGHAGLVGSAIVKVLNLKGYSNIIVRTRGELNLTSSKAVNDFFEIERPEYVILSAAKVGGIAANNKYRAQFIYENLMIQNNIIHASYLYSVKKLLFLGSTCIYPRDSPQPMKEEYLLTSPLEYTNEPYAIAKIAGIKMCESYNLQYDTNFISVMPSNLYGPNDNFNLETAHVLPALMRKMHLAKCLEHNDWEAIVKDFNKRPIGQKNNQILAGHNEQAILEALLKYGIYSSTSHLTQESNAIIHKVSVNVWGTGAPMREFLWSEDLAEALVYCLENIDFKDLIIMKGSDNREIRNTHINIGTGKDISIKDIAFLIKDIVGFQGEIVFDKSKPDGVRQKLTDPSKMHELGWHYKMDIKEGIENLYKWYLS